MRLSDCLRWFGFEARVDPSPAGEGPAARPPRKLPGTEVLGLVALFGAIDTVDPLRHSERGHAGPASARSSIAGAAPAAGPVFARSTFAIHWEPLDREATLIRDPCLSDGWVHITMDRSAT